MERDPHTLSFPAAADGAVAPLHLFSAGMQLGNRYEIRSVIDWGGFAVVYVAYDKMLHREIAMKVLRPDRMSDAAMARFRREVAVARDASSPRLVRVFDIETSDGAIYLTMELIEGGSLRKRILDGPIAIEEVIRLASGIAEGLQALHALGIVHRDIKPANVLLDASGEVKLADFGLARHLDSEPAHSTTTGTIVGTLAYLSPEHALGHPVDHRTDLYSLGVVIFEMLTGRLPFEGASALGTLLARMKASPEDVRQLRADCPRWLAALVARLLERDPDDRYPSAEAVLADLRRRRSAFSLRRLVRSSALLLVLLLVAAGAAIAWRAWIWRGELSHLIASQNILTAVSRSGHVLWRLEGFASATSAHYVILNRGHDGEREIAVVLRKPSDLSMATMHRLSFLDPDTGAVKRTVVLPVQAESFGYLSARYQVGSMKAIDLDDDGAEEVLTTYTHIPEWPSYTALYEPRIQRARTVLVATGHHHVAGVADVDGDGHKELLVQGIHNGWGWQNAASAVRLMPPVNAFTQPLGSASTPDLLPYPNAMVWYTYLPRGQQPQGIRITREDDRLHIRYPDRRHIVLTLEGVDVRLSNPRERAAARDRALLAMRDANRLMGAGSYDAALATNAAASRDARQAGLPQLADAAEGRRGRILVAAGRIAEAETHYESLSKRIEGPSDLCLEAGESFHLAGDLDRALKWYRRALSLAQETGVGHSPHEIVKGLTLAAAEAHRYEEGQADVARFMASQPGSEWDANAYFREYLRWRSGDVPEVRVAPQYESIDLARYWFVEFLWARGENASSLLARLPVDLEERSPTRSGLLSLHAELLDRLGRRDEARRLVTTALRFNEIDRATEIIARSQTELVRERHARLMRN